MSISSTAVKKTALTVLKDKYLKSIITSAIYVFSCLVCLFCLELIGTVAGSIAAFVFFLIFAVFLIIPITLGLAFWGVRMIFGNEGHPILIFNFFTDRDKYLRAIRFSVPFTAKSCLAGAILFLPAFITKLLASGKIFNILKMQIPIWASGLSYVSEILEFFAFICLISVMMRYYLTPFLLAADEKMDAREAMNMSRIIAGKSKKDFVWLILSLGLYIIACIFMVPIIFILPYFTVCFAVHCRFAVAAYNKNADKINSLNIPSFRADISF